MVRLHAPKAYDAALIERNGGMIAQLAPMIPDMFAIDTSASDITSQAKADIWGDYADFSAKAATTAEREKARQLRFRGGRSELQRTVTGGARDDRAPQQHPRLDHLCSRGDGGRGPARPARRRSSGVRPTD